MWNPLKPFQEYDDSVFSKLIEIDFSKDLEFAVGLASIPEDERDDIVNLLLNDLRQKYSKENPQYFHASKNLRDIYDGIEEQIKPSQLIISS